MEIPTSRCARNVTPVTETGTTETTTDTRPTDPPATQHATGARAIAQIKASLGTLVASERRVAEVILADPRGAIGSTASQLGKRADTSATTVIRFARNAGFEGYQQLAIALAVAEPSLDRTRPLSPDDTPAETLRAVASIASSALSGLADTVDRAALTGAVAALAAAPHTLTVGAALSAPVAQDLAFRLNHLGLSADAPADSQIQRIRAAHLTSTDVLVAFLHGGTYAHVVETARGAKAAGATVIAVTSFARTPLAELADFPLVVGAQTADAGIGAWASRLSFLAVVDALILSVLNTDPGRFRPSLDRISEQIEQDLL